MTYKDLGAVAVDAENGDITEDIVVTGVDAVDDTTPGVYEVKYNVKDRDGVPADEVIRTVTVIDKDDFDFKVSIRGNNISYRWGGSMYVSYDNEETYSPISSGTVMVSAAGITLIGKNITSFSVHTSSDLGEVMVEKAYKMTYLIDSFYNSKITKFEVAHKNVFPNAKYAKNFLGGNDLEYIPELYLPSIVDCGYMYKDNPNLKCVAGVIDTTPVLNANYVLVNCPSLIAPDAAGVATIRGGGKWTNPGACP